MNHHLAASGNLGQVLKKNFPIALPDKMITEVSEMYNIVGPLCTPIDRLATKVWLPTTELGDLIAIFASGAYGYSSSPIHFLSHPAPNEIVVDAKV
jgi:diaminopimelate decarboxylase